jgi:hypothetical protein
VYSWLAQIKIYFKRNMENNVMGFVFGISSTNGILLLWILYEIFVSKEEDFINIA